MQTAAEPALNKMAAMMKKSHMAMYGLVSVGGVFHQGVPPDPARLRKRTESAKQVGGQAGLAPVLLAYLRWQRFLECIRWQAAVSWAPILRV